nr:hypothetical protein [Salmonella enterica subsp. salamae]
MSYLQTLGFPRKNLHYEENILANSESSGSHTCKANPLKSTRFTLSSLVIALFLSSNMAYADNAAYGEGASASGAYSSAFGENAKASGDYSTANGAGANASKYGSTANGTNAVASGNYSAANGTSAVASGDYSTANGWNAKASGNYSTANGTSAVASGDDSTANGTSAVASGKNSVALGADSRATHNNEVNIGIWEPNPDRTFKQTGTRTISGLAAATQDDEAVNKKQLEGAINNAVITGGGVTEEKAQQIADTAKTEAIAASNGYTDTEIGKLDSKSQGYASAAQTAANGYTDTAKTEAIAEANKYTDKAALEENDKVLKKANTYTDDKAEQTLKSVNDNTERRAVVAEKRSQAYTDERSASTLESANTYTNHRTVQAENNAVARSNDYTDNRFGELRKSLEHTEKRLNAGIAGVTALSSIPYASGNKFSYGIGAGNYRDGNAVAAGVQFLVSQSTNVRLNISWDSAGNNATGVGIAGGW